MLAPELQQKMEQLTVFRCGFSESAARNVAGADAHGAGCAGRQVVALIRLGYGSLRTSCSCPRICGQTVSAADQTRRQHARYYLTLLAQQTKSLQQGNRQDAASRLDPDAENIRLAWHTGLTCKWAELLTAALAPLSFYFQLRGLNREAEAVMQTTFDAATTWGADGATVATRAALELVRRQNRPGHDQQAVETAKVAVALATSGEDRWAEGMSYMQLGEPLYSRSNPTH